MSITVIIAIIVIGAIYSVIEYKYYKAWVEAGYVLKPKALLTWKGVIELTIFAAVVAYIITLGVNPVILTIGAALGALNILIISTGKYLRRTSTS